MSKLAAFEKQIDKLVATCVEDINKQLKQVGEGIKERVVKLANEVKGVRIPQGVDDKELQDIPSKVKQIVDKHNAKIREGVVKVRLEVSVEAGEDEVWTGVYGIAGPLAGF
jgi:3-methyladenine DNA glycosylase AlkC